MPLAPSDSYLSEYLPDCPVQPEVWRRYQEVGPSVPVTLIMAVKPGDSPPVVMNKLRDWFAPDDLLNHGSFILVDAMFEEMVTALLPLTNWQRFVARAAAIPRGQLLKEVTAVRQRLPATVRIEGGVTWGAEDRTRLRWLIEMVATVFDRQARLEDGKATTRMRRLLTRAAEVTESDVAPLASVGLNRRVLPAVCHSRSTVKADAAGRVFDVNCGGIRWAVIDTGIDRTHPAFAGDKPGESRVMLTFDVAAGIERLKAEETKKPDMRFVALYDDKTWEIFWHGAMVTGKAADTGRSVDSRTEHGTHVAGILGSNFRRPEGGRPTRSPEKEAPSDEMLGICPTIELVDIRVFDDHEAASEFNVIVALAFVRWLNSRNPGPQDRIDGVNISLSVPFAVDDHACGWTPVCQECDRLVKSGVVVVAAAGNAGFSPGVAESNGFGFSLVSISDPGNAEAVITVGSTDSHEPHRYGPSSRSARGPTADGRHKPDLLAPGIRVWGPAPGEAWQRLSGTSMAAPHVSGVAAMLIARFPELRGQPERIKEILCRTATDLGRNRDFQGFGLVDALRALQDQ